MTRDSREKRSRYSVSPGSRPRQASPAARATPASRACRRPAGSHPEAFLHDVHLSPDSDLLQAHGDLHLAGQVRIVEPVGPAKAFVRDQLQILAAKRVALAGGEIGERHLVGAAYPCIHLVDSTGETNTQTLVGRRLADSTTRRPLSAARPFGYAEAPCLVPSFFSLR